MDIRENINESLRSIKSNLLRTVLTGMIIAIGITSLVGILTAIDGIQSSVNDSFADLGANTFTILNRYDYRRSGGRQERRNPEITYRQANTFADNFREKYNGVVSLSANIGGAVQVKYNSKSTNPNSSAIGIDETYLTINGYKIDTGRNINKTDMDNSMNVAIIGQEIATKLFEKADPLNKEIVLRGNKFKVIGVLEKKGSFGGGGGPDRMVLVPLPTGRALAANRQLTFNITASAPSVEGAEFVVEEARGLMRRVRGDTPGKSDSFVVERADSMMQEFNNISKYLRIGGFGIGIITLLGASIALMNIMMVSVTERTREIGIRKSLGAAPKVIRLQFLFEAVIICILGGLGGLVLGIMIGNVISNTVSQGTASFVVPWLWMILGILVCVMVGVISGIYPAIRASKLDPIEALRYE